MGPKHSATTGRHVALLRGINVGGKNKLPMKALVDLFVQAGCSEVSTYIQSGNVVFTSTPARAVDLPQRISTDILRRHGLSVPVVLRSARELERVVRGNPFLAGTQGDTEHLHVLFLADTPAKSAASTLDLRRSAPDEFVWPGGREVFLRCPQGVARTKLTNAYFDARLATTSTGRNWRTVLRLAELSSA